VLVSQLSLRQRLRILSEAPKVELATIGIVLIYLVIIVADITVPILADIATDDNPFTCDETVKKTWQKTFWTIDMCFLSFFMLELGIRVYAWGTLYFRDPFNTVDSVIIVGSFAFSIYVYDDVWNTEGESGTHSASQITRLIRIVRVFRLLTALTKFHKNRANTEVVRKKVRA
jgi:hypothetical protein